MSETDAFTVRAGPKISLHPRLMITPDFPVTGQVACLSGSSRAGIPGGYGRDRQNFAELEWAGDHRGRVLCRAVAPAGLGAAAERCQSGLQQFRGLAYRPKGIKGRPLASG